MPNIIWKDFHKGQTSSPYMQDGAFTKAANIDVWGQKGVARIDYKPIAASSGLAASPGKFTKEWEASPEVWATVGGALYESTNNGAAWAAKTGGSAGSHPIYWKSYVICPNQDDIDVYDPSDDTWDVDWGGAGVLEATTAEHFTFHSRNDDKIYVCDDRYIDTIEEVSEQNFDPTNAGTYTITTKVLTLPEGYKALCLEEQGEDLLIGAIYGDTSSPFQRATIFVWDRAANEFQRPISVPENAINTMFNLREYIFVSAGLKGNIYVYTEAGLVPFIILPFDYDAGARIDVGRNSMGEWKGNLIIGTESIDGLSPAGLFRVDIDTKAIYPVTLIHSAEDGSNDDLYVGGVLGYDTTTLLFGYQDNQNTDFGINRIQEDLATQYRWTSYGAYMESPLLKLGTSFKPVNYQQVEIQLARPLRTGEGVILKYRNDVVSSWVTMCTMDFTSLGAVTSYKSPLTVQGVENLQLRVELTTGASSLTTPNLLEVRLIE